MTRVTGRNVLVLIGAYYLSILVGMPFFILFAKLEEGHVYQGDIGSLVGTLVNTIPMAVDAIIAGVMAGWLVESRAAYRWAWGLGLFLFLASLSSHHWKRPPEAIEAVIVGLVAVPAFLATRRLVPGVGDERPGR
jgi:hypothetical protein